MKIGNLTIDADAPVAICGELGINHLGNVETAKKLIDVAVLAGCQFAKLQTRNVDEVYTAEELAMPRESPFGHTNGDLKRGLEFSIAEFDELDKYCDEKGIILFSSPWSASSVDFLENFDVPCYKVASACITDLELLRKIRSTGKPVIMSTGMSTEQQVINAMEILGPDAMPCATVSTYPCKIQDLNLLRIQRLISMYGHPVGYSGHEVGLYTTLCAVALGANYVERHITLSRESYGSDQAASVEPQGLIKLVQEIRTFEQAKGSDRIEILNSEMPILEKLRRFK